MVDIYFLALALFFVVVPLAALVVLYALFASKDDTHGVITWREKKEKKHE